MNIKIKMLGTLIFSSLLSSGISASVDERELSFDDENPTTIGRIDVSRNGQEFGSLYRQSTPIKVPKGVDNFRFKIYGSHGQLLNNGWGTLDTEADWAIKAREEKSQYGEIIDGTTLENPADEDNI